MQRLWPRAAAALALAAAALLAGAAGRADESPLVGTWKLINLTTGDELTYALIQVEEKDGKLQAKLLGAAGNLGRDPALEGFHADARSIRFDLKSGTNVYRVKLYPARGIPTLGTITTSAQVFLARLEKTDDTEWKRDELRKATPEGEALTKARTARDAKDQQAALKEILEKYGDKPVAYAAAHLLLQQYVNDGGKDEALLRAVAERAVKAAADYGPEAQRAAATLACHELLRADKVSPVAAEMARRAENGLTADDSRADTLKVLKLLGTALRKTGKDDELKQLEPRIEKMEAVLDQVFEQNAVPFKPGQFKARKGDNLRVAVVELFTGAYCPPCVAADVAFDAGLETYKPADVIFLQYHIHVPQPDRLTNPDTLARAKFYGEQIEGVPTAFVNGKPTAGLGGVKARSQTSYQQLRKEVEEMLEAETPAGLKLSAERTGDKIDVRAEVTGLNDPAPKVRLRFVVMQEVVRYPGGNGQRLHRHIVRAMPGGADGVALKGAGGKASATVNLGDLRQSLDEYMTKFEKGDRKFRDDEYPLKLHDLKVVALIQDDSTHEIIQAAQVDVPDAK
jgi:hypothetical protein